jgi:hypothetical protein
VALCLTGLFDPPRAEAAGGAASAVPIAVVELDYVDTSGEVKDQTADHQRRLRDFANALQRDLAASGRYRAVPIACGAGPCSTRTSPSELEKAAREAGAKLVVIGGVHKESTLIQWAKMQVVEVGEGRVVFDRLLTFRGDNDAAWSRAEAFVANEILESSPGLDKSAVESAPVKLAVFDFELEDLSAGGGIIPESDDDREQLRLATEAARRLIAESGRYSLVDVSKADAAEVKTHTLRQCDGCDAGIARKLGADQSLVGIVNRVSRMEYGVTFEVRDARTGKLLSVVRTDLRMGANYSWNRGAAWLVKNRFLERQAKHARTP